ncbi:hypothetical protein [Dyadobacter sp. CY312]|uniref:hypothetical protein n=1 Tax=Dyadobacter sp. CY312 TaxID=2907303 RepID=UPI001F305836|nr:hypothetical protein [Dyadobacter sp. CY312]MCE7042453.1 hypothetical protein [Dyadobacter sp. CY312]
MVNKGFSSKSVGTVSGVFFTKKDADNAYHNLIQMGHTEDDISVLMSDETLSKNQVYTDEPVDESALSKAANAFTGFIISITSMISLPGVGIAISNTLQRKMPAEAVSAVTGKQDVMRGSGIPEQHFDSYDSGMREGGIIISVDPRNGKEKKSIIQNFRLNNGTDILGDDGYTEFG